MILFTTIQPKQVSLGKCKMEKWLEKLGKNFRALILHTDYGSWKDKPKWQAKANRHIVQFHKSIYGNTPEEALENLYNELKKINK